jgi:hypothetical protein
MRLSRRAAGQAPVAPADLHSTLAISFDHRRKAFEFHYSEPTVTLGSLLGKFRAWGYHLINETL